MIDIFIYTQWKSVSGDEGFDKLTCAHKTYC